MKRLVRIILISIALLICIGLGTTISNAATETVGNEQDLKTAISNANSGDTIELSNDIALTSPVEITGKTLTIKGQNHTVTRVAENWTPNGSNGSLVTAGGDGTKLTLENMTLTNSQKYGVQAFNGAHVVVDGVKVNDCGYGGIIVNAGVLEVKDLSLGRNGNPSNNGIEIAKGSGVTGDNIPVLIMNGKLTSTQNENVIYLAENDNLITFEVRNTDTTENKLFVQGRKVVLTDANNAVIFESNENSRVTVTGTEYTENTPPETNETPNEEPEQPNKEPEQPKEPAKTEEPKRTSPKTGAENHIGIAIISLLASILGIVYFNKKTRK